MLRSLLACSALLAGTCLAQTEADLYTIAQSGIGSNGFGTTWRGQDVELTEDAWLTKIVFQAGSAASNIDEIRLMTSGAMPVTLRATTTINSIGNNEVEGVLAEPYLLRVGTRYTIWFHQTGSPRGTYGCDLHRIDRTWGGYHTNNDPTQGRNLNDPSVYWGYQYGTNCRLVGYDNLEITGSTVLGGTVTFTLETATPQDLCLLQFAGRTIDVSVPGLIGPLRLDLATLAPPGFVGTSDLSALFIRTLTIPNDRALVGVVVYSQAAYDATFTTTATFSPMDSLRIQ